MKKNKFLIVVGTNGTGKTQNILRLAKYYKSGRKNILAINPTIEKKFFGFKNKFGAFPGLSIIKPSYKTIKYMGNEMEAYVFPEFMKGTGVKRQAIPNYVFGESAESSLLPVLEAVFYSFSDGLLIIDDCSMLLRGRTSAGVESIFAGRRQKNLDIITVFHSLGKIPPSIIPYATGMILHKVIEKSETYSYKIAPEILKAKERVSAISKKKPTYFEYIKF